MSISSVPYVTFAKRSQQLGTTTDGETTYNGGFPRIRECYSRDDLLLPSILTENEHQLVIVPTASTLDGHFETLLACGKAAERALILGSVVNRLKTLGYGRTLEKVRNQVKLDVRRKWIGFADENFKAISSPRTTTNTLKWLAFFQRRAETLNLVILSENMEFRNQVELEIPELRILSTRQFVEEICHPSIGYCNESEYKQACLTAESADLAKGLGDPFQKTSMDVAAEISGPRIRGMLRCTGSRTAFIGSNAYVPTAEYRNRAIHGDIVEVVPIKRNSVDFGTDSTEDEVESAALTKMMPCRVISVIKSADKRRQLVVTLDSKEAERISTDASKEFHTLLCIPMDERYPKSRVHTRLGSVLLGKRFLIELTDWPEGSRWPNAKYIRTIGTALELSTESSAILVETELDGHEKPFPLAALEELPPSDMKIEPTVEEVDLRHYRVLSIDPIGCQDIDDAISLESQADGSFELGVHIADVARFVRSGGALDREASSRATSVYLQERRLDMLPGVLCENLCSLRPQQDRFAVSVLFRADPTTFRIDMQSARFQRTIIRSRYALAYEQAQRLADGHEPGEFLRGGWTGRAVPQNDWTWIGDTIRKLMNIARVREKQRKDRGAVTLEAEAEFKFALDAASKPQEVFGSMHMEVHDTIAELMILANEAAARLLLAKTPTRALVRHHPPSDPVRFQQCIDFARGMGFDFDASSNKAVASSLQLIRKNADKATSQLIESLAARAMSEAQYVCAGAQGQQHEGSSPFFHFGLGLDHYTHFTSPIRRYADLIVARLILEREDEGISSKLPIEHLVSTPEPGNLPTLQKLEEPHADVVRSEALFEKNASDDFSWADALGQASDDEDTSPGMISSSVNPSNSGDEDLIENQRVKAPPSISESMKTAGELDKILTYSGAGPSEALSGGEGKTQELHSHATTQSVQEMCEHINSRHRSAKEASYRSQQLFFSLYFADRPTNAPVSAVVYSVRKDGVLCYVPEFDLRIPVRLVGSNGVFLQTGLSNFPANEIATSLNDVQILKSKDSLDLTIGEKRLHLTSMSHVALMISCDMYTAVEIAPGPRVPEIKGALMLTSARFGESQFVAPTKAGKERLKQTVIGDSDVKTGRFEEETQVRTRLTSRKSLYTAVFNSARTSQEPMQILKVKPPRQLTKISYGGFVPKARPISGIRHYLDDQEEDLQISGYVSRKSASDLSNAQMKRLEIEATKRIAKLQAQKYDSRVKRRMKKE